MGDEMMTGDKVRGHRIDEKLVGGSYGYLSIDEE